MGVLAPPWVRVTCEGGFSCQGAAEGQGAGESPACGPCGLCCPGCGATPVQGCAGERRRPESGPEYLRRGTRSPGTWAPRGKSLETLFLRLCETCLAALQPGGLWGGLPGLSCLWVPGRCMLARGLQKWSWGPGPIDMASPEPVSRPHVLSTVF